MDTSFGKTNRKFQNYSLSENGRIYRSVSRHVNLTIRHFLWLCMYAAPGFCAYNSTFLFFYKVLQNKPQRNVFHAGWSKYSCLRKNSLDPEEGKEFLLKCINMQLFSVLAFRMHANNYIDDVVTETPYSKPLERYVIYIFQ